MDIPGEARGGFQFSNSFLRSFACSASARLGLGGLMDSVDCRSGRADYRSGAAVIAREAKAVSMPNSGTETMQLVILVLVAIALLVNSALVVVMLVGLGKLGKMMKNEVADLRASVMPMVYDTRELLTNISPKIESSADDLSAILHTLRSQSAAFESVGTEMAERLRRQASRAEDVISGLITTADRTSSAVADSVGGPIRKIAGMVASARAIMETLRAPAPIVHATRERDNRDLFV